MVVGVKRGGNAEPCAVLLMRDEKRVKQPRHVAGIIARVNESLAEYQRMRSWFLWPEADFPRTSTGKPKLPEIRMAVEAQWGNSRSGENKDAANGGIGELIARMQSGRNDPAGANANLENDLRLSSIDRVELMDALEDRYQVDLDETRFASARTIGELETLVRGTSSAKSEFVYPRWAQCWPVTWIRSFFYYLLTWPATHLMAHPRVIGREKLRGIKGPVIIISNHVIYLDVGFVLAALPWSLRHRLAVAMGGERLAEMRQPPREWFFAKRWLQRMKYFLVVSLFNVFPLPQSGDFSASFEHAARAMDRGFHVLVFPEGELTRDGRIAPFRAGIGLLAARLKVPVVPLRLDGLFDRREAEKSWAPRGHIRVSMGAPVRVGETDAAEQIARDREVRVGARGAVR